ncbi:MAG: hypothetical protein HYZ42_00775 [Bacteroidetes bacterium]|nr:hypothetical protein [Bacteroidota bacterium]
MENQITDDAQMINKSLHALITSYGKSSGQQKEAELLTEELYVVFSLKDEFMDKLERMDTIFDKFTSFREIQEVTFDLLMVRYLSTDTIDFDPEYFDSEEWLKIEDLTLDRGTELLNILIYIKEANDVEAEISIDDFLDEFLLVDDENFGEEQEIYSLLIDHKDTVEEPLEEWITLYNNADNDDALKDYILPLFSLFSNDVTETEFEKVVTDNLKENSLILAYNSLLTTFANKI